MLKRCTLSISPWNLLDLFVTLQAALIFNLFSRSPLIGLCHAFCQLVFFNFPFKNGSECSETAFEAPLFPSSLPVFSTPWTSFVRAPRDCSSIKYWYLPLRKLSIGKKLGDLCHLILDIWNGHRYYTNWLEGNKKGTHWTSSKRVCFLSFASCNFFVSEANPYRQVKKRSIDWKNTQVFQDDQVSPGNAMKTLTDSKRVSYTPRVDYNPIELSSHTQASGWTYWSIKQENTIAY